MGKARVLMIMLLAAGCGGGGGADADGGIDAQVCQADPRSAPFIYHGTTQPTYAPLTEGQILAIGAWSESASGGQEFCSGTLITPEWVVTANHCGVAVGNYFCFGADVSQPVRCLAVAEVHTNPTVAEGDLDLTVARLEADATTMVTGVEPIPLLTEPLPAFLGQLAEISGFGDVHDGTSGVRFFSTETIDAVGTENATEIRVNGLGQRGACYGDSGGPLLVIDSGGAVRVGGTLFWGDDSCVDQDRYTRIDLGLSWVESFTGATAEAPTSACGPIDGVGICSGERAVYCQDSLIATESCADCGWDDGAGGYRCITGTDSCAGWSREGGCDATGAHWCADGTPYSADCDCLGQICVVDQAVGGAGCIDDPCMGIDYLGECQGNVAVWCEGRTLQMVDCAAQGSTCAFIDSDIGYYCQ
ncbi:MAG TPA: S1 family peptidase [Kofleriaceae bacterium]|nr:S1 family peptidase [Kofleriaceae bacterium]